MYPLYYIFLQISKPFLKIILQVSLLSVEGVVYYMLIACQEGVRKFFQKGELDRWKIGSRISEVAYPFLGCSLSGTRAVAFYREPYEVGEEREVWM